jgi:hypothetical protein
MRRLLGGIGKETTIGRKKDDATKFTTEATKIGLELKAKHAKRRG